MKNKKTTCKTQIGGQAVMEGVMMRSKTVTATAVRDGEGNIQVESKKTAPIGTKNKFFALPIIRGVVNFFESMVSGVQTLMRSSEVYGDDAQPSKFEIWLAKKLKISLISVITTISMVVALALSILLFVFLPQFFASKILQSNKYFNLVEGGLRLVVFVLYILCVSLLKDIRRVFMYHGAEHKTINCFEQGLDLTIDNVRSCKRLHNRCGTTFLFFVMFVSILVYSIANISTNSFLIRFLSKVALLPLIAGISYEMLKLLAKTDSLIFLPLKAPGLLLQRLTTKEPDDGMIEVAITAFERVLQMEKDPSIAQSNFIVTTNSAKILQEVILELEQANITDRADAEWIVAIAAGIERSQIANNVLVMPSVVKKIYALTDMRKSGMPLWYVIGDTNFYGITLKVDQRVLIPRPETEELVQKALQVITASDKVLDLCCGSGAIAITVAKNSGAQVFASDISQDAIDLAKENALLASANVTFINSDMFSQIEQKFSVIISNPPYIRSGDIDALQREVTFEPRLALDGGQDGLNFYKQIAKNVKKYLYPGGCLFLECGENQSLDIVNLLDNATSIQVFNDLEGKDRIIKATF